MEVCFRNIKNLGEFILAIQRKERFVSDYFGPEMKIDIPHFMISQIRKMKMASKKNTSKPFFHPQGTAPTGAPTGKKPQGQVPWQQPIPGFVVPGGFFVPQQGMIPGAIPPLAQPIPPKQQPNKAPSPQSKWTTVQELLQEKKQFLGLKEDQRQSILRNHILSKLQSYGSIIDLKNKKKVDDVCGVFLDKEIIDPSDLVDSLANDEEFENLLKQAIDY